MAHRNLIIPILLAAIVLAGCAAVPAATTREPLTLSIVHTNDTLGYLRPCG